MDEHHTILSEARFIVWKIAIGEMPTMADCVLIIAALKSLDHTYDPLAYPFTQDDGGQETYSPEYGYEDPWSFE